MCGFLVEYCKGGELLSKSDFLSLLNSSQKRGPDSQGYYHNGTTLQMGFNRLAILDLTVAGDQPIQSYAKNYSLVFNGEVYNHLELRASLDFNAFQGHSDSETIAACIEEWGLLKTVNQLNGMFSMVVYDHRSQSISLVRDFAGIKPLFYGWDGKTLVVASQYDQIVAHKRYSEKTVDSEVLKLYLQQQFVPPPFGLYRDTFQVRPGEVVSISKEGDLSRYRYWELPKKTDYSILNKEEALELIGEGLDASITRQLLSDVPVGAFLSGGVDSALIGSTISRVRPDLRAFTIGSDSNTHDESERASQIANAIHLQHEVWSLSATEVLTYWEEAMQSLHEPLADFSILPTYLVSKLAKKQVTVALSGDGGDELFFGYERFWSLTKNHPYFSYPYFIRRLLYLTDKVTTKNRNINSALLMNSEGVAHQGMHSRFPSKWLHSIAPELMPVALPEVYELYDYGEITDLENLLQRMRYSEFYGMMQKTLRKVDLASMENSLEVRVPFLDKQMIEVSMAIQPTLSTKGEKQKILLKSLLSQRIPKVPEEKVKKGFSIPLSKWIKESLHDSFYDVLLQDKAREFGFVPSKIESLLKQHMEGKVDAKWPLFTLYALLK